VSESKTKPYRYYISYLLRDLAVGAKFEPSELHITILPWFAIETDEPPFIDWFYRHFDEVQAFEATAARRAVFGPKKDVPVSILEPEAEFMKLHVLALSWFGAVGARWAEKDPYVGDDYIPHVAQRRGYVLAEGQKLLIDSVSLFKASRREDRVRMVAAKAIFREK
jgi:2'-5' RNA ligase